MTVKELIDVLEKCNKDAQVELIDADDYNYIISSVKEVRNLWDEVNFNMETKVHIIF